MLPAISLIIPTHNRANLIVKTIQSALDQVSPFAEIIVVDDASTDDTLSVLQQFANRIDVIALSKVGVQVARNTGVAAAGSPYVALCDSDDLLASDYVATMAAWFAQTPACDGAYSNFQTVEDGVAGPQKFSLAPAGFFGGAAINGVFYSKTPHLYDKSISFQPLFPSGAVFSKAFYETIGGFDQRFNGVGSEDWEFTLRAISRGDIALCTKPLVQICKHAGNDSKDSLRAVLGEITVLEHARAFHAEPGSAPAIAAGLNRRRIAAFELAFGRMDYVISAAILPSIVERPGTLKFRIKAALIEALWPMAVFMRWLSIPFGYPPDHRNLKLPSEWTQKDYQDWADSIA